MSGSSARRWNHNIHYHRLVLDAVPRGAQTALDVGTGNGLLAADLVHRVPQVVAIDLDPTVLRSARSEAPTRVAQVVRGREPSVLVSWLLDRDLGH
ncbi:methyltransferase domain-containing protein [Pseudonocardia sp. ICBG1142]|uniref:class I SAM-dependent methyltransferase n=1 Tax=Pseudonocardia sp. ICBG1142 TaxID=2846760 RepID=UPI001CF718B4